ncbi:hypothetical protein [Zhongshania sp.]|uniref:hypothetical protein n=1 Tax=Zhongshania sp. TaxID=1971902 RepID=UPI0035655184
MQDLRLTPVTEETSRKGIWAPYYGAKLRIARMNSPAFINHFNRLMRAHKSQKHIPEETSNDIMCQCLSKHVLVDWEWEVNGEKIPYSKDNAYSLLFNDTDARDFVVEFASDLTNYLEEQEEEAKGKSSTRTSGG